MLTAIIVCAVLVAGLVFYAMHRSRPTRFALKVGPPKFPLISIEVEAQGKRAGRELPTKPDDADGSHAV